MTKINAEIDFVAMAKDISKIKQAVLGNGVPGLCDRVSRLEKIQERQGWVNGFFAGMGFIVGGLINFIISLFKGG